MQRSHVAVGSLALLVLLLAWRGCGGDGRPPAALDVTPAPAATPAGGTRGETAGADLAAGAAGARHAASMGGAVSTLHRYLTALGEDAVRADTFWVGGRPPPHSHEADLRSLTGLRALRIGNRAPIALDSSKPPDAVEIPVELRISTREGPLRHYQGWYRLRRTGDGWRITSAAIDASPPRR